LSIAWLSRSCIEKSAITASPWMKATSENLPLLCHSELWESSWHRLYDQLHKRRSCKFLSKFLSKPRISHFLDRAWWECFCFAQLSAKLSQRHSNRVDIAPSWFYPYLHLQIRIAAQIQDSRERARRGKERGDVAALRRLCWIVIGWIAPFPESPVMAWGTSVRLKELWPSWKDQERRLDIVENN
jgi:hypothetical protein